MGSPLLVIGPGSARARRSPFEPWFSGLRGFGPRTGGHRHRSATPGRARRRQRPSVGRLEGAGRARRARPAPRRGVRGGAKRGGPADAGPIARSAAPRPGPACFASVGCSTPRREGPARGSSPARRLRQGPGRALRPGGAQAVGLAAEPTRWLCVALAVRGRHSRAWRGKRSLGLPSFSAVDRGSSGVASTPVDSKPTGEIAALALRRVGASPVEHRALQTGHESTSRSNEISVAVASAVARSHLWLQSAR